MLVRDRLPGSRRADSGFTLIELLITVAIMGVIISALAGVVISYFRNIADTQSRLTESQDVQFAATYWQRDVASMGVRIYDETTKTFPLQDSINTTPACALPAGDVVVTLAWSEFTSLDSTDNGEVVTVSYVATGASAPYELVRVRCTESTIDSSVEVAHSLTEPPNATCVPACSGTPEVVDLDLSVLDPDGNGTVAYSATLSGERRQS
ncbi:type II secretion system protein J [Nocardioides sp. GCM10030258]|uniref:type II secretion system protein J n=1 Tax=unclassified Nocardioides TaxID=2615069 RepID=UPI00360B856D